jgi:hypothetical protein
MKYFKASERFTVTARRGKEIKVYLNGNLLGNLSQSDSIRTSIVTPDGIRYLEPKPPEPTLPVVDDTELKPLEPVFR